MKKYIFSVLVATGAIFTQFGIGSNADAAMMDACQRMADEGNYPEDDIECVTLMSVEEA